ncbi:MAG: Gfo/Idh/MocA family oxidoreductase [Sedimentisphaerales bacterium]|nr:Gfo/Idh/MocA family oxidoreductase [Sedimentisphaerales bacterium]
MMNLRAAVIGAGKMGRLHSRIYHQIDGVELAAVVDTELDKARGLTEQYGGEPAADYREIIDRVDVVTVATPTEHHAAVAEPFLRRGLGVLVEKPIAATLDQARRMLQLAQEHKATLQVGHSERFNPVVQAMGRIRFTPRFIEVNRISPYTFRSTDIGVVYDMMIHDIDIVLSLVRRPVQDVQAAGVNVLGAQEDIANARVVFEGGCVANLTASRLALKTERKVRVFSEDAYLSLDYFKKTGVMISRTANLDMLHDLRRRADEGKLDVQNINWTDLVKVEELDIDDREPLRLEQEAFVAAVRAKTNPVVSAADGVAAMELAERIIAGIGQHEWEGKNSMTISARQWHGRSAKVQTPGSKA